MSESAEESQRSGTQRRAPEWLDRLEQVDRHVASTVKKMVRDLHDLASAAEDEAVGQLLAATARVDGETTQSGILNALLEESQRFASRAAFFLTRPGEVRGWAGQGFSNAEGANFDYEDGSLWSRVATQTGVFTLDSEECGSVCRRLGAAPASAGVVIPFILRGQLGGVLYADALEGEGELGVASLQLLTHAAAQAVETAAVRRGGSSPALHLTSDATTTKASLWQPPEDTDQAAATSAGVVAGAAAAIAGAAAVAAEVVKPADEEAAPAVSEEQDGPDTSAEQAVEAVEPEETGEPEAIDSTESDPAVEAEPELEVEAESELEAEPEVEAELEAEAEPIVEAEPELEVEPIAETEPEAEAVDFEMVSEAEEDLQAVEDIEAELEPEPELEDTSELWAVEEEEEEEATFVGSAPISEPAIEQPAIEQPAVAQPAVPIPPEVGQETVRLDIAALQGQMPAPPTESATEEETARLPQWEVEAAPEPAAAEIEPEPTEPTYEIEPTEPVTASMSTPDFSEDATIISPREDLTSPTDGGYVPPAPATTEVTPPVEAATTEVTPPADMAPSTEVTPPADMAPSTEVTPPPSSGFAAPPAAKPDATGTSQVVPPTDIQGPGSAFGAASDGGIPEGEEALHEEARRLARLLVSEIKLYNEEIIEEGRRSGNIYERLKDDIDRSRQMYTERIDPRLSTNEHDYFRQELVQRLAGGDERLLGY